MDAVVGERAAVLQLLAREDEALLGRRKREYLLRCHVSKDAARTEPDYPVPVIELCNYDLI